MEHQNNKKPLPLSKGRPQVSEAKKKRAFSFSLDSASVEKLRKLAALEQRNMSNYIDILISKEAARWLPEETAETKQG